MAKIVPDTIHHYYDSDFTVIHTGDRIELPEGFRIERNFSPPFPVIIRDSAGVPVDRGGRMSPEWWAKER